MEITLSEDSVIEPETIKTAIDLGIPIEVFTYSIPPKTKDFISLVLKNYLEECSLSHLYSKFNFCINELLLNALKANAKRVHFIYKDLDIDDPEDYEMGMKTFRNECIEKRDFYLEKQKKQGLYVRLSMLLDDSCLNIEVSNNSIPTDFERKRLVDKVLNCHKFTAEELKGNFVDETEGAGLGINSVCLSLRSLGIAKEDFQVDIRKKETIMRIRYPLSSGLEAL